MTNREFTATRTMLANAMATAGAELLEYMGTAGALAAIPNTDPPRYVVAGTLQIIAKLLPTAESAPAVPAPSQVPAELSEERIYAIYETIDWGEIGSGIKYARAIERELRAGSSDVRDQARIEQLRNAIETVCEGWTLPADARKVLETALWTEPAEAPAASKEGDTQ